MAESFISKRTLPNTISPNGTIRRVSRSVFAAGEDVVSCSAVPLCKCLNVGNVKGLHSGDIVKVFPDGKIIRLWDVSSFQNCLFVTNGCNFRCPYCFERKRLARGETWLAKVMSHEMIQAIFAALDDYRSRGYGLGNCTLYGGEPLMKENLATRGSDQRL